MSADAGRACAWCGRQIVGVTQAARRYCDRACRERQKAVRDHRRIRCHRCGRGCDASHWYCARCLVGRTVAPPAAAAPSRGAESTPQTDDDGTTQTVTAKAGVVLSDLVRVPNPVRLRPYRTFREIDQPESVFVFRLQSGKEGSLPTAALFEADGGQWKLEAVRAIAGYLTTALAGRGIAIVA